MDGPTSSTDDVKVERRRLDRLISSLSALSVGDFDGARCEPEGDPDADPVSAVELLLDALSTELREVLESNEVFRDEMERAARDAEEKLRTIERQRLAIEDLSTPIIEVWEGVLTLPIIGVVDTRRSLTMTQKLLHAIVERRARSVIIDLTGVEIVDTVTADHLARMVRSAAMLGASCVVTGINPEVAQTMARLGVDLGTVQTYLTLKDGLQSRLPAANGNGSER